MAQFRVPFFGPCFGTAPGAQTVRCISSWPFSGSENGPCFGAAGEPQNMTRRRRGAILPNVFMRESPLPREASARSVRRARTVRSARSVRNARRIQATRGDRKNNAWGAPLFLKTWLKGSCDSAPSPCRRNSAAWQFSGIPLG